MNRGVRLLVGVVLWSAATGAWSAEQPLRSVDSGATESQAGAFASGPSPTSDTRGSSNVVSNERGERIERKRQEVERLKREIAILKQPAEHLVELECLIVEVESSASGVLKDWPGDPRLAPTPDAPLMRRLPADAHNGNEELAVQESRDSVQQALLKELGKAAFVEVLVMETLELLSGESTTRHAGSTLPLFVDQQEGESMIEFRNLGFTLDVTIGDVSARQIPVDVSAERTAIDDANSVMLDGRRIPSLSTQRIASQLEFSQGETVALFFPESRSRARTEAAANEDGEQESVTVVVLTASLVGE